MLKKLGISGDHMDADAKPLVRLRMCHALLGAVKAQALQAESDALAAGIGVEEQWGSHWR